MRESVVFYKSFYEAINKLPEEYRLEVINAVMQYSFEDTIPEMTPVADAMFTLIKPNIDSATQRYEASVENGKKGGRPRKNENLEKPSNNPTITQEKPRQNLDETQQKPNHKPSKNLNDNVDDNVDDNDNVNDNVVVEVPTTAIQFYLHNINSTPVETEMNVLQSYQKDLPDDVLIYGMQKAVEKKARNLSYIKAIWNSWIAKGITTLAEAKEELKPKIQTQKNDLQKLRNSYDEIDLDKFYSNLQEGG